MRIGHLTKVDNHDRRFGAARSYYAIWIRTTLDEVRPWLLTGEEMARLSDRADTNVEDIPKLHRVSCNVANVTILCFLLMFGLGAAVGFLAASIL